MSDLREMSELEIRTLEDGETLASQLPITFESGFVLTAMTTNCGLCGEEAPADACKAHITRMIEDTVTLNVVATCPNCNVPTVTKRRVKSDSHGTRVQYQNEQGEWVQISFKDKKRGFWSWVKRILA